MLCAGMGVVETKRGGWLGRPGGVEAILACVVFAVYLNSVRGPWILDDIPLIERNPLVRDPSMWAHLFSSEYWSVTGADLGLYRPLPLLTYGITWNMVGNATWLFHLSNIALHAVNSVLVWRVGTSGSRTPLALACTLLFALHPVHTEAVANVAGRPELLVAFGFLLVLLARKHWSTFSTKRAQVVVGITAGSLIALFSKEHALLLLLWVAFARGAAALGRHSRGEDDHLRSKLVVILPISACSILYLLMRYQAIGVFPSGQGSLPFAEHFRLATSAAAKAFQLILFPVQQRAIWEIPHPPPALAVITGIAVLITAAVVVVLSFISRKKAIAAAGLMFLAATPLYHPIPNIIWLWERGLYVSSIALSWLVYHLLSNRSRRHSLILVLLFSVSAVAGVRTAYLSSLYSDSLRFWRAQNVQTPSAPTVVVNYSQALIDHGDTSEAVSLREAAHRRDPRNGTLVSALASSYVLARHESAARDLLTSASQVQLKFARTNAARQTLQMLATLSRNVNAPEAADRFLQQSAEWAR